MSHYSLFLLLSAGSLIVLFVYLIIVLRRSRQIIHDRLSLRKIIMQNKGANFIGQKSNGMAQIRGNGVLALSKHELLFYRAVPFREFEIPIRDIREITIEKSFLGKSVFRPLLCIHFQAGYGEDAIA